MRPKSLILLALALGCGLVASIGISQVLDGSNKKQAEVETVPIYVALKNINLGDPVDDGMVSLQEWPKDKVPMGAITSWEEIDGRRPRTTIFQGEPLNDSKFLPKGVSHDPIAGIPPGMRLKTISVDARQSVAGLLSPGDRVDIQLYVTRNKSEEIMHPFTKIILQNIRVYAVDQAVQRSADGLDERTIAKTVSLVVTPQQANRMTTAENLGSISLIPRHPDDDSIVEDWEQDAEDLLARSDSNTREKERDAFEQLQEDEGVRGAIEDDLSKSVAINTKPPFRMRIIYPNESKQIDFSAETGELLEPVETQQNQIQQPEAVAEQTEDEPASESKADSESPPDFPIDL